MTRKDYITFAKFHGDFIFDYIKKEYDIEVNEFRSICL